MTQKYNYSFDLSSIFQEKEEDAPVETPSTGLVPKPAAKPAEATDDSTDPMSFMPKFTEFMGATYDRAIQRHQDKTSNRNLYKDKAFEDFLGGTGDIGTLLAPAAGKEINPNPIIEEPEPVTVSPMHKVASGDTLSKIAKANDTTVAAILTANPDIKNPNKISVGQDIVLPSAEPVEEAAPVATQGAGLMSADVEVLKRYTVTDSSLEDLYATKGPAYKDSKVVSYSYYKKPIVDRFEKGNSRRGGDAPKEVQKAAIEAIITQGVRAGLSKDEIALTLAIAKHESGFNPDAAAGTTSAHGLGQFVNKTGKAYGLNDNNRWSHIAQARALVKHTRDNIALAKRRGKGTEYVYKYHHDGPTNDYGGLATSKNKVMPLVTSFSKLLDGLDIPDKPAPKPKPVVEKELAPETSLRPRARSN